MTIDERLDKLTERHEALAQTVELLAAEGRLTTERIQMLAQAASRQFDAIDKLTGATEQLRGSVDGLAKIAEAHEHRITHIEGGTSA